MASRLGRRGGLAGSLVTALAVALSDPKTVYAATSDGHVWATHADGTLLVVRQGKTPKKLLQKTLESIENLRLVGVVMNTSEEPQRRHYSQYYAKMEQASVNRVGKQQISEPENPSLPDWAGSRR